MGLLSELDQARAAHPGRSDAALVEQLAAELGAELELEPPIDIDLLASARGIARIELADLPWSGCLLPGGDGLRIQLRANDPHRRRRFTGCHEVSHTLLPGFSSTAAVYRCTPGDGQPSPPRDRDIESLADLAASEFLLPRRHLATDLRNASFGWSTVEALAHRYEASLDATARRCVAIADEPTLFLHLRYSAGTDGQPRLRLGGHAAQGDWPRLSISTSVPKGHPIDDARHGLPIDEVADLDWLTGAGSPPVRLSARSYPYTSPRGEQVMRVLVLATPARTTPAQIPQAKQQGGHNE
jgi:hypothetical protein